MADSEALRLRIYRQLAAEGRVDPVAVLAADLGEEEAATTTALRNLARRRHVVLDDAGEVVLAHPFATRDFGFSVKSDRTL